MENFYIYTLVKRLQNSYFAKWDETTTYTEGKIVIHNNAPYQCKEGGATVGTWVDAEWQLLDLASLSVSVGRSGDSSVPFTVGCDSNGFYVTI